MERVIFLIDMQTFYASCEKAVHPELRNRPLIVAGDPKQRSGIVLAACSIAKERGVSTAEPVGQALLKCPDAVVIRPSMQHYIDVSLQITATIREFTDLVEPYSIDEQFADVTGSLHLYPSAMELARQIQQTIFDRTSVYARIGLGTNKVLAKMACDNFSKYRAEGIFRLDACTIKTHLWPLPIGKLFGVGHRMERHLLGMGIRQIGHLAHYPVSLLRKKWGVNGELLWMTAHGIDTAPVSPETYAGQKSVGHHMTLPFDYVAAKNIRIVLLELSEEVAYRARNKHYRGDVVSIGVTGRFERHSGFQRQIKLPFSTNFGMDIYHAANRLFTESWDQLPVRGVAVTLSELQPADVCQLDLFSSLEQKEKLSAVMDTICQRYGRTAIFRGVSLMPASQLHARAVKIGGHFK
ncbi:MAG: DNA polymerase IV [Sporolactobacillus sp.]